MIFIASFIAVAIARIERKTKSERRKAQKNENEKKND
jgi:hypothetical protein